MRIPRIDKGYRNLRRYRQIVGVLIKYGFSEILRRAGATPRFPLLRRIFKLEREWTEGSYAARLRLALEELILPSLEDGPVYTDHWASSEGSMSSSWIGLF